MNDDSEVYTLQIQCIYHVIFEYFWLTMTDIFWHDVMTFVFTDTVDIRVDFFFRRFLEDTNNFLPSCEEFGNDHDQLIVVCHFAIA